MRSKRIRFTIRSLMIAIAIVALPLALVPVEDPILRALALIPAGMAVLLSRFMVFHEWIRFTIWSFVVAIAVLGVLLAFVPVNDLIPWAIVFAPTCLVALLSRWLVLRDRRRLATILFWSAAIPINIGYAGCCAMPTIELTFHLWLGWSLAALPLVVTLADAWALLATRQGTPRGRSWILLGPCVFALAILPSITLSTLWPLRAAFFVSKPYLERLADQVHQNAIVTARTRASSSKAAPPGGAGATVVVDLPRWAGVYRVDRASDGPEEGSVHLWINSDSTMPIAFVRVAPAFPLFDPSYARTFRFFCIELDLGGGWWYREPD